MMEAAFVCFCKFRRVCAVLYESTARSFQESLHLLLRHLHASGYEAPSSKVGVIIKGY